MIKKVLSGMVMLLVLLETAQAQYPGRERSGSVYLLPTRQGANLPASASEDGFPLLVRLHKDFFNFSEAKAHGEDIRFSTSTGTPLAYQIEEWAPQNGIASIWVRIPTLKGNARQEIKLYWGKTDASSASSGSAVFNESNGYLSVWHMNEPVKDEVDTVESKDVGTTATEGVIGPARHFAGQQGIFGGDQITDYPEGAGPHSSEAWFRADKPNSSVLADEGKVALMRGPITYCLEAVDNPNVDVLSVTLPPEATRRAEHRDGLLGGVTVLQGKGLDDRQRPITLTAVPYYAWANREKGAMTIWISEAPVKEDSEADKETK